MRLGWRVRSQWGRPSKNNSRASLQLPTPPRLNLLSPPPHTQAFAKAGFVWTRALCEADSDGDGLTNGEELGDPCCEWSAAADALAAATGGKPAHAHHTAAATTVASHPGVADAAPPPGLRRRADVCAKEHGTPRHTAPTPDALLTGVASPDPADPTGASFFLDFRPATPFTVPGNQTTTYGSLPFNLAAPTGEALDARAWDITAIEPLLDGRSAGALHHFDFALCRGLAPAPGVQVETPGAATSPVCGEAVYVWTAGGAPVHRLPARAGLRFGKGTPIRSLRLGTHYHTPPLNAAGERTRRAVADTTGVRLHVTRTLRAGEAALLWAGPISHGVGVIPPAKAAWYVGSACRPQLGVPSAWARAVAAVRGLPRPTGGVSVYAFLPHMHKLGRAQGVTLLRPRRPTPSEGESGPAGATTTGVVWEAVASLGAAVGYSYSATHYVPLTPAVTVLPGDVLVTTCVYNSTGRGAAVHGGLGSDDEMCIGFLAAHPAAAAGAARHCEGVISAGDYTPYAALAATAADSAGGGTPPAPAATDPPPALHLVVDPRPPAPADWHLDLNEGRLACDRRALLRTAKAAVSLPDPGAMLAAVCGPDWARLAQPTALRQENGAWVAGHGPPASCDAGCARAVYNWLACSRTQAALGASMGGLAMLAAAVEPVADAACGHHLAAGVARPPLVPFEAGVVGGLAAGGAALAWAVRRRRGRGVVKGPAYGRPGSDASPHRA